MNNNGRVTLMKRLIEKYGESITYSQAVTEVEKKKALRPQLKRRHLPFSYHDFSLIKRRVLFELKGGA